MQTTPKANNTLGHFFALLGAVVLLAIATWVSASSSEQVQPLDNLVTPRTGHTATALSDGRILITGGRDNDGNLVAAAEIFDPETQTSSASGTLHTARADHSATVLVDGRILIAGGSNNSGPLSSAEMFDPVNPAAGFQEIASPMTAARTHHTATLLNNGNVLIAGGETAGTAEIFDPTTQSFTPTLWNLSVARSGHTATLFTDDSVLLAGGNTASMEMYTPLDQKFTLDAAMLSVVRTGHWAFELSDTRLLLFQGDTGNSIDEFNPGADTITPKGSLNFHASSSTLLANGKVLVLGTDISGLYDPDAAPPGPDFTAFDETTVPHSGILPRSGQSAVTLPGDKKILIAGGANVQNIFQGMALFNPARIWTDRDDYHPGDPVVLSGSGWKANEDVYLYAVDDETQQWTYGSTETAGADGSFVDSPYFIVQQQQLGATFTVTAVGAQSNMQADVEFTDAASITWATPGVTLTVQSGTLTYGTAGNATYTITLHRTSNGNASAIPTITGLPAGATGTFSPSPVNFSGNSSTTTTTLTIHTIITTPAGSPTFTVKATDGNDSTNFVTGTGTLTVNKANATVVVTPYTCPSTTYTGLPRTATVSSITGVNGETGATVGTVDVSNTTHTNAGTYPSDTWSFTGTANYNNIAATTIADCIAKATATVVVTPYTCPGTTYDGHSHTATFTLNGVNGETGATVGMVDVSNTTHTAAGTYASDFWFFTGAANYNNIATTTITDCIAKANATVVVTPYTCPSTIYDGLSHTAAITSITGVNGETGATVGAVDVSNTTHVMAGTYSSDSWSFTGTANYNNIAATTITDCIAKKDATWTTNPNSKTYGNADPNPLTTGSGSGFAGTESAMVTASYSRDPGETVLGGPYHITTVLGPADVLANYNITNAGAAFTINTRLATWTTNPASKMYGNADPVPLTTGSGDFLAADGVTATYSRDPGETVLGGPYHITATLSPAAVLTNYNITNAGAAFTINTRPATWITNPASKTYGNADPVPLTTGSGDFLAADGVTATYGRDPGETVLGGPYHITATLIPAAVLTNYSITNAGASFTIDPKTASVTPDAASKTYGAVDPAFTGTLTGFLAADGVTATYSRTTGETVLGGPYTISATLSPAALLTNYNIAYNTAEFTITTRPASVTPDAKTKEYGALDPTLTGALAGFLAADGVTATYSRTAGETVLGGPYTISAVLSPAAVLSNYNITYNTATFTITTRAASVTPDAKTKEYGALDPTLTGALSGFLAADGVTATYSRTAGETVLGGPYTISAVLSPAAVLSNYNITYNTASFTITTRAASVTPDAKTKEYGALDPTLTGALSGFLAADGVTATYSRTAGETVLGGPYTISAVLSPAAVLSNYNITYNTATFTITTRAASVTPDAKTKEYGALDPTLTGALAGFLAADGVTATYSRTAGETVLGGPYTISAVLSPAAVLSNYNITYNTASFTITTRAASVTPDAKTKEYGALDPTLTGALSGFLAADGVTATYSRTAGETVLGGPYTISAVLSPTAVLSNYNITYNTATFTITTRAASVTPDAKTKEYGAVDPAFTGALSGFLAADGVTATYSRTAGETVLGGPYTISAVLSPTAVLSNYNITYNTATFTITTRAASVTPDAKTKEYGAVDPAFTGALSGFLAADGVTATYSRTAGETVLGGPYTISAVLSPTAVLSNYNITYNTATFTITTRAASVTPDAKTKEYGAVDPAFTGALSGFLAADGVTATYSRTAGETVLGGPYTISAVLSPTAVLSNYNITYNTATFTITTRAASVTPDAKTKEYGAVDPAFTGALSGFLAADGVTATYSRTAGETVLGGPYTISAVLSPTAVLSNYNITYNTANLTITTRAASVTPDAKTKEYGALDPAFTGALSGFLAADGVTATYSRTSGETVLGGPYTISAVLSPTAVLSNYNITYNTANLTITTRAASVTPDAKTKEYGALDPAFTGALSGFLAADGVTATYSRTSGETVLGGPYTISAVLSPAAVLSNYNITYNTAEFTITTRPASVTPDAKTKEYGAIDPALTGALSGFLAADGVTATYSRTSGETVLGGPYTINATLSPAAVLTNYNIAYNTAEFSITTRPASVTPDAKTKEYGAADPAFTGTLVGFLAADGVTATYSRTTGETVLGGPYTISATLSPAGVLTNYSITYNTVNFTIDPKTASVTPNAASKTYGGVDPAFTGTLTGFLAADGVTATYSRTTGETVLGGPYTISATLSPAGVLTNYSIMYNTVNFTIDPKTASVTPNAASKTYGAADPAFTGTLTGFLAADGVTASYSRTAGETVLGGPYTISATLSPAVVLTNYSIMYNTANFTIDPKAASVTPNAASKTYGAADPAFTGSLTGFLGADGVTASYSRTAGETVLGGPYTISATLSPAVVLTNYSIMYNTANFTIDPKTASVTPNAASKTYGAADPAFTGTLTGFLTADGVAATYSRTAGETVLGGPYTISATLSPAGVLTNYSIMYNTANFTIDPKAASVTPNAVSKTYGAVDPALTGTLTGFLAADGVTATYSRAPGEFPSPPTYQITATLHATPASLLNNYIITYNSAQFSIVTDFLCDTASTIPAQFHEQPLAAGRTVWFNNSFEVRHVGREGPEHNDRGEMDEHDNNENEVWEAVTNGNHPVTFRFTNQTITFRNGQTTIGPLAVPDAQITFTNNVTTATTTYDVPSNTWITTLPAQDIRGRVFASGLAYVVPAGGFQGNINPVNWTARISSDTPGLKVRWTWGAATFSTFSADYNALGVVTVSQLHPPSPPPPLGPMNRAGVPLNFAQYAVNDARGRGGNPAGWRSRSTTTSQCGLGTFISYTQAEWGQHPDPHNTNAGSLLTSKFASVYPGPLYLSIGTPALKLTFTTVDAIQRFLPAGGKAGVLQTTATNPNNSKAGVLAGQVLALQINVDFASAGWLGDDLRYLRVVDGPLAGWTVQQVLAFGNQALGGGSLTMNMVTLTFDQLNDIITNINQNFDSGTIDSGFVLP